MQNWLRITTRKPRSMLRNLMFAAILLGFTGSHLSAKTLEVPAKNPMATITIPDSWKLEEIDFGYSGQSPDGSLMVYVESATGARFDKMLSLTEEWMTENKIKLAEKADEREITISGMPAKIISAKGTDKDGPTVVDFVFIPAGEKRVIMLTLWGSEDERKTNSADLDIIRSSVKALK